MVCYTSNLNAPMYLMVKECTDFITPYCVTACLLKLLRDGQSGVRFLAESRNFSLLYNVQIGSEAQPNSYPLCMRVLAQNVERPYFKADHLTLTIL